MDGARLYEFTHIRASPMTAITGKTRFYCVIADPIRHVKAPEFMNQHFAAHGIDSVLVGLHVTAANFATALQGLRTFENLDGFITTVPHKTVMLDHCDEVTPAAAQVGSVNVVRRTADGRFIGDILDGKGFVAGLRQNGIEPTGQRVYLAGAGGAGRAIAFALAEADVAHLTIANRTRQKAQELRERIADAYPRLSLSVGDMNPSNHDIVVNGTSLGLHAGDELPCDVTGLTPSQIVAEIIMDPVETPLLIAARRVGCRLHYGAPMFKCQMEMMAAFLSGTVVPITQKVQR
jgi:shikimate dehydrogenase